MADHYSRGNKKRKHPKRCTLGIYHSGCVILFLGIIIIIVALATSRLFHVYIYDHRKPAKFLHVQIPIGLFSVSASVVGLDMEQIELHHNLEMDDPRWVVAKAVTVVGLFASIGAMLIHLIPICRKVNQTWVNVLIELLCLLIAVITVLIGLSLAESEIEYIHDHGDLNLSRMLALNGLLGSKALEKVNYLVKPILSDSDRPTEDQIPLTNIMDLDSVVEGGEFALFLTPPLLSFFLLITADFLFLAAFLAVLIYFVRVCEKAEQARKEMRQAQISHA